MFFTSLKTNFYLSVFMTIHRILQRKWSTSKYILCALTCIFKSVNNTHFEDVLQTQWKIIYQGKEFGTVKNIFYIFTVFLHFKSNHSLKSIVKGILLGPQFKMWPFHVLSHLDTKNCWGKNSKWLRG